MSIKIEIDGNVVQVPEGSSVLDAINTSGIYLPQLCKDPDMKSIGACRTCLVEVDGAKGFPASCSVPATDGLKIWTNTPSLNSVRKGVLELTMAMVKGDNTDNANGHRELTVAAEHYDLKASRWRGRERELVDSSNRPMIGDWWERVKKRDSYKTAYAFKNPDN